MADKADEKKGPSAAEESLLLPYERVAPTGNTVEEDLFNLIGSGSPDFRNEDGTPEEADDEDELESDDESDETDDDEDDDDDEEGSAEESEDEDDEDDDDDEDDGDEDNDEDDDEDSDEDELHEVTVQGETFKVTLEEALSGYMKQSDYTQKTQLAAKELAEGNEEVRVKREHYDTRLTMLEEAMVQMSPAAPDEALRQENPGEYAAQKADQAEREAAVGRVRDEKARVKREKEDEYRLTRQSILAGEVDLLVKAVPEFRNKAKLAQGVEDIRAFAQKAYGFSDEDLDGVIDHRVLLLIRENMENRSKKKAGKKEIRRKSKKSRRMKPGGGERPTGKSKTRRGKKKANERARSKLARSGSVQDAAAAIENLLGDDDL